MKKNCQNSILFNGVCFFMKKIYILSIILFGLVFYFARTKAIDCVDLRLDDEIGVVFINKSLILVLGEEENTLLTLDKEEDMSNLSKFKYDDLNVLMLKEYNIDIDYDKKIIFDYDLDIGDIEYSRRDGVIYITYEDTNMCIYMGDSYNISDCQFVYFYETKVNNILVNDYQEIIFHHYRNALPNSFLEEAYKKLVDTYQIRDDELAILKIGEEDYDFIVIGNN